MKSFGVKPWMKVIFLPLWLMFSEGIHLELQLLTLRDICPSGNRFDMQVNYK